MITVKKAIELLLHLNENSVVLVDKKHSILVCPNCFNNRKIIFLQQKDYDYIHCQICNSRFFGKLLQHKN